MKAGSLFAAPIGDEVALRERARALLAGDGGRIPDASRLEEICRRDGVNLATSLLHEALLADERHGELIRRIDAAPVEPAQNGDSGITLVVVPGMFYREYPEIGADGGLLRNIAARFGIRSAVVPTQSLGAVTQNVGILHDYLDAMPPGRFWLASMSRGSAEIKMLLQKYAGAPYLENLGAWISICGIVDGSPLHEGIYANRVLAGLHRAFARLNGVSPGLAHELLSSNPHWQPTRCPPGTNLVNVIAMPLDWHVTQRAIRRYRRIRHLGPNDGVVLLQSYLAEPGGIYPVWGVDHFLRTARIPALFCRLVNHLLVQERGQHEQVTADRDFSGRLRSGGRRPG